MCLYPQLTYNGKYKPNKKNGGIIPTVYDTRVLYVPRACGNCMECKKQKSREWSVRLQEHIKHNKNGKFVTLTFSNESIAKLAEDIQYKFKTKPTGYLLDNLIATKGMRMFNERWRKIKPGKALHHWTVTELGHKNTENIHLHGIVWTDEPYERIREKWKYGWIYPRSTEEAKRSYVNNRTINYTTKYICKMDLDHKTYTPIILSSPGIGKDYVNSKAATYNKYNGTDTLDTYRTETGHEMKLPIYWRNKIFTDEEREKLWIIQLEKETRYINGIKVDISKGEEEYYNILKSQQELNKELGYGNAYLKDWKRQTYEQERRKMLIEYRIEQANKKRGYDLWKPIDKTWYEY